MENLLLLKIELKYGSVESFQKIYPNSFKRFKAKADILIALCNDNEDIVILVSTLYSDIENRRIIIELPNAYIFNLLASPNIIFDRIGYYDEKGILLSNLEEYKLMHKDQIMKK